MTRDNTITNGLLVAVVSLTMFLSFATTAAAAIDPGTSVQAGDDDLTPSIAELAPGNAEVLCNVDADSGTDYDAGEVVIIDVDGGANGAACDTVEVNDVPLTGDSAGEQVTTGDDLFDQPLNGALNSDLSWYDANGDLTFNAGDTMYIDINNIQSVSVGDVRLTAYGSHSAMTTVQSGDDDLNLGLTDGAQQGVTNIDLDIDSSQAAGTDPVSFFDADGDGGFDSDDSLYIDIDDAIGANPSITTVSVNDIRLTAFGDDHDAGTIVESGDVDLTPALSTGFAATPVLCNVDQDGQSDYDSGETIIVDTDGGGCGERVEVNDVPLTGSDSGVQIATTDNIFDQPLNAPANVDLEYYDANGDNTFNPGDTMYIDLSNTGAVAVGDVRLTAYGSHSALTTVNAGASDMNLGLTDTNNDFGDANLIGFFDADGDTSFDSDDSLYVNTDAGGAETIAVNDVRLTDFGNPTEAGTIVQAGDDDLTPSLSALPGETLCVVDSNGGGTYDSGEVVVIDVDGNGCGANQNVAGNDVPLSGDSAGERITTTDSLFDQPTVVAPNDNLAYYDANGDGTFNAGDTMYIDVRAQGGAANTIGVGDVRLTAYGSHSELTTVSSGDSDINLGLVALGGGTSLGGGNVLDFFNEDGSVDNNGNPTFNGEDTLYINVNNPGAGTTVGVNDIRLTSFAGEAGTDKTTADQDGDGIRDSRDNCPTVANADQADEDGDGTGDACEDADGDGVFDSQDNCPDTANEDQADADGDGVGDACDDLTDSDGDGIADDEDNCPETANADQADADGDGIGDACDDMTDTDGDGVADDEDNCPDTANADQADLDADGTGDACDDTDDRPDADGDGIVDADDACPQEAASTADGCPADSGGDGDGAGDGDGDGGDGEQPEDTPAIGAIAAIATIAGLAALVRRD